MSPVTAAVLDAGFAPRRATRRGKSETRENLNRRAMTGVDGCNSGARLRHGHLSHTLVSSLLRRGGELSSARERADSVAQRSAGSRAGPGAGPRAGPGAGPGASLEARLLPSLRISATVYDVPRASFAVRSPSA